MRRRVLPCATQSAGHRCTRRTRATHHIDNEHENQVQVAYIGSAGGGSGTLYYRGQAYPFRVGGLGVGGIGASTISASGEVYKMSNLSQFPGAYGQARYGFALGQTSGGDLWLQNPSGVILHLKAKRTGLMLSLGGDAVIISMR